MVDAVNTNELANAIDATKKSWRRDTNNLGLAGQMQFGSVMNTVINSPEKLMELATYQSKASKMDDQMKPAERDDFRATVKEQRRAAGREVEGTESPDERQPQRTKQADKPKTESREKPSDDDTQPKVEVAADTTTAPSETSKAKVGKSFHDEIVDATPVVAHQTTQQNTEVPVDPAQHVNLPQAETQIAQAAQAAMASALTDKNFSRVGEDLHDAVAQKQGAKTNTHIGAQTAANSLKDEQSSDLSNRLAGMGQFAIHVDTGNEAAKSRQTALSGLGANVNFGQFEGLDGNDQALANNPFKGSTDGTEQKAPSTHGNVPADRAAAATSPQDIANAFGQALRAQAAMAGPQGSQNNTEIVKAVAPAEAIQSIGAVAPSGPSQLSQTAKANPTTAARQPEKAQTPAEQIAVKIRQAIGDGTDKINIKLNPHELGRVEVRLELSKDGSVTATVLAERQDTLDILQKDTRGLERALNDAGLRTDATSLSFGLRGDGQKNADVGRERKNGNNTRNDERAASRIEFGDNAGTARSNAYQRTLGANSGVDIRV